MVSSNVTGFGNRPLKSSSNSMLVVFESDSNFESKGFSAQYSMVFMMIYFLGAFNEEITKNCIHSSHAALRFGQMDKDLFKLAIICVGWLINASGSSKQRIRVRNGLF